MKFLDQHNAFLDQKKERKKLILSSYDWRSSGEPVRLLLRDMGDPYESRWYVAVRCGAVRCIVYYTWL